MVAVPRRHPYRLLGSLGRGGYAEVFRAEIRDRPGAVVAFKRPLPGVELAQERMAREISVQRSLDHENIMPILDSAEDSSWFVMPLADGNLEDLRTSWDLGGDIEYVAGILRAIGAGLQFAHESGYIHRDVSPRNILALPNEETGQPRWVIADWGLVRRRPGQTTRRLTETGESLGTAGFAAPETWDDAHAADVQADVYSLGRVAAWLLTGAWPAPNRPLLPEGPMRGFVHEATLQDARRRLPSIAAMFDRLDVLLARPPLTPRSEAEALVELAIHSGVANEAELVAIAEAHEGDADLYLDELARLPLDAVERLTHGSPDQTAATASAMLEHLRSADWGNRDFNYANIPLGWAFRVLTVLVRDGEFGLAEDLATLFFAVDSEWNRFRQHGLTVQWLKSLGEPEGEAIARALRRAGVHDYYASSLAEQRLKSRSLAAEFGQ
jgi:serine/threonine protein kinase